MKGRIFRKFILGEVGILKISITGEVEICQNYPQKRPRHKLSLSIEDCIYFCLVLIRGHSLLLISLGLLGDSLIESLCLGLLLFFILDAFTQKYLCFLLILSRNNRIQWDAPKWTLFWVKNWLIFSVLLETRFYGLQ